MPYKLAHQVMDSAFLFVIPSFFLHYIFQLSFYGDTNLLFGNKSDSINYKPFHLFQLLLVCNKTRLIEIQQKRHYQH